MMRQLLEQHSPEAIGRAVAKMAVDIDRPQKKLGRRPTYVGNLISVWAHVEYRRVRRPQGRLTDAVNAIAKDLERATAGWRPTAATLRRMHWEAKQKRATESALREHMDRMLEGLLAMKPEPGQVYVPVLWRQTAEGLEMPAIDRMRRGGRGC